MICECVLYGSDTKTGIPPSGKSKNNLTGEVERGVSVYEALERNGGYQILLPRMDGTAPATLGQCYNVAQGLNEYPWVSMSERSGRKDTVVGMLRAFEMFPEFKEWYDETKVKVQKAKEYIELFNGDLVKEITNTAGVNLGALMKFIKSNELFTQDFVLNELKIKENVQTYVLQQFNIFKGLK